MKTNGWPRAAVAIFFLILAAFITYKAIFVPITFDESAAAIFYPHFTVTEIIMFPTYWPSNHILNTLCIKFCEFLFGTEPWSVRLPNMLAFVLCYFMVYRIAVRYFDRSGFLFCLPFFALFCNPFLLDFFGLARGYGMSNTLMVCSVYFLLRYSERTEVRWYVYAIIFAMLAAYANFTLLIYWVAIQGLLMLLLLAAYIRKEATIKTLLLTGSGTILVAAAFMALCYTPLHKMQSTNQFVYWSREGFFKNTLLDQITNFRNGVRYWGIPSVYVAWIVVVFFVGVCLYVLRKAIRQGTRALQDPLVVVTLLLCLVWGVNKMQTVLLGTPNLTTRTALSYYVLFIFVLVFLIRDLSLHIPRIAVAVPAVVVSLFAIHLGFASDRKCVREWWFNANDHDLIVYLEKYRRDHGGKEIDLNCTWLFNPTFCFYKETGKAEGIKLTDIHHEVDTLSRTQFYYATGDDAVLLHQYTPLQVFYPTQNVLLIHK